MLTYDTMIRNCYCEARLNLPLIRFLHIVDDVAHARGIDHVGDGGDSRVAWWRSNIGNPGPGKWSWDNLLGSGIPTPLKNMKVSWAYYSQYMGKMFQTTNQIYLLKMAIEIVDLPMNSMVIFHSYVTVYQRVYNRKRWNISKHHYQKWRFIAG